MVTLTYFWTLKVTMNYIVPLIHKCNFHLLLMHKLKVISIYFSSKKVTRFTKAMILTYFSSMKVTLTYFGVNKLKVALTYFSIHKGDLDLLAVTLTYLWSTKVNLPSILWRDINSVAAFGPMRSLQLGVLVTWRRPIATRQQWPPPFSSVSRSICTPGQRQNVRLQT